MELVMIDIDFFDPITIKAAGAIGALPTRASFPPYAVPTRGDLIRFSSLTLPDGSPLFFRVTERTMLAESARLQLNLTLVAAFPQLLEEESSRPR